MKNLLTRIISNFWMACKDNKLNRQYYKEKLILFRQKKLVHLIIGAIVVLPCYFAINQQNVDLVAKVTAELNIFCARTGLLFVMALFIGVSSLHDDVFRLRKETIKQRLVKIDNFFISLRVYFVFIFVLQWFAMIKQDYTSLADLINIMLSLALITILDLFIARLSTLFNLRVKSLF